MTDRVPLPALDGLEPVGFLASLGVLRVLSRRGVDARLSFDPYRATAELSGLPDIDSIVDALTDAVESFVPGELLLGLPPSFVATHPGTWSDPARIHASAFRQRLDEAVDKDGREWARALWTDLATDEAGRCATTPFYAPTGRQTLRSMFEKPAEIVRSEPRRYLREALQGWRRIDGFTGENLDVRAVRGAAEQADGKPTMSGVPGATWLALSSIPMFPMGGDGRTSSTTGWHRVQCSGESRRRLVLGWPVWHEPLDAAAARSILGHVVVKQAVHRAVQEAEALNGDQRQRDRLRALGVERVVVARRRALPGGKSAGVLVPVAHWG